MLKTNSPQASQDFGNPHSTISKSNFNLDFSKIPDGQPQKRSVKNNDEQNSSFNKSQPPSTKGSETNMPKYSRDVVVPSDSRIGENGNASSHQRHPSCPISILRKEGEGERRPSLLKTENKGNKPEDNKKKPKIKFRKDIEDVKIIENWKHYNQENYQQTSCHCNVF